MREDRVRVLGEKVGIWGRALCAGVKHKSDKTLQTLERSKNRWCKNWLCDKGSWIDENGEWRVGALSNSLLREVSKQKLNK